ncbi:MAG TPA: hypothetical protein VK475_08195 [Pyrinomonadaceae bacterium]|nr:hypothetical protein [Pyrinomonadaceae bacterium]
MPATTPSRGTPELLLMKAIGVSQRKLTGLMGSERVRRHPHRHD